MVLGLSLGLVLFLCCLFSYRTGLKDGRALSKGTVPEIAVNPIKTFKEYLDNKEVKKKEDLAYEGWHGKDGILNYDPYNIKEVNE